ncbi:Cullin-domain-containing protein [Macrolepiota fuliginosa MF-IS2]|uniref:Cullin-domain-containing protein n=1 Tax=Macrolepiota fuliginosa MF-IS2 TaxID=1400762 RepID=A0A9P6C0Q2_9AGAR|nr:Cullin-domain-containing protein [Macrolepiota fuliginosa MF-IS2]
MATTSRRPVKKQIKVPKKYGPDFSLDNTWTQLKRNIREIQHNNASNLSFEENHRFGYNMVLNKQGHILYNGLRDLVREHLNELAQEHVIPAFPIGSEGQNQEGEVLLKALRKVWDDHTSSMSKVGQILKYMDRVYVKPANVPETAELGHDLFLDRIIRDPIRGHLVSTILDQIRYEREGYMVNRSAIQGCVDVLLRLHIDSLGTTVYRRDVEPAFLDQSTIFYQTEGKNLVQTCDAPEFLERVEYRFESEDSRAHHYLNSQTAPAIRQILKDHLLTPHLSDIISMPNSGLDTMIDTDKLDVLSRLYRLYMIVPTGLPILKRALKESIARRGKAINESSFASDGGEAAEQAEVDPKGKGKARAPVNTLTPATEWVQRVLELKDKFDGVWQKAFQNDHDAEVAINEAFESFINLNDKCSEYLSLFIDDHLRRGLRGKNDTEIAAVLDKTITVFRYVTEKDVFERYYKGHLAKRLLQSRSVSEDAEREMLGRLKVECGYQFTQKLEGMFNDIRLSEEAMESYQDHLSRTTPPEVAISVIVMTSTYWPMSHSASPCHIPSILAKSCQSFERFYLERHSGRRLTWQYGLGNADVRTRFKNKVHDLTVSTFAVVILFLFEELGDDDFLTYSEIKGATAIVNSELKRHLQSLACGKFKILKKHPPGREINDDDSFSFNNDFTSPIQKIKIATVSSKVETTQERKETRDRIDEERKHQIDACIVRIMKDRKHMSHNDLVNEAIRQLAGRFNPEPGLIKRRVESLIEREYLERCEDRKSYNYLA